MSAIMAWLGAKGSAVAIGAAIPVALMLAGKLIPKKAGSMVAALLGKNLGKLDEIQDPIRRGLYTTLALDIVRIVEHEIPDKAAGEVKFKAAADKICAVLPFLKGQEAKVKTLIEDAVAAMDAELKKQIPG